MRFLHWLPEDVRQKSLDYYKGCRAVKHPASYFMRVPKSMHLYWKVLSSVDNEGMLWRTGPDFLVDGLIKTMEKYEQPYEVVKL